MIATLSSFFASSRSFPKAPTFSSHRSSFKLFSSSTPALKENEAKLMRLKKKRRVRIGKRRKRLIGDGGDGAGVVLRDVEWGERVLSVARQVLLQFGDDFDLHAFKVSPKGYIYLRLDMLSNEYGCPSMEEIENFSNAYKKRLDEIGESGEIPDDLGLQVSSPGAERLLKIPDDLDRFKDMPMRVSYLEENPDSKQHQLSEKVVLPDSVDI